MRACVRACVRVCVCVCVCVCNLNVSTSAVYVGSCKHARIRMLCQPIKSLARTLALSPD